MKLNVTIGQNVAFKEFHEQLADFLALRYVISGMSNCTYLF